jgi:predicted esterase
MRMAVIGIMSIMSTSAAAAVSVLDSYNIPPSSVTIAGPSSGGYMAVQMQVAYSKEFHGTAVIAGGAYYCLQYSILQWASACTGNSDVPLSTLVSYTKEQEKMGNIDPTINLSQKPIYMFSGTLDSINHQPAMNALYDYYLNFTSKINITYNNYTPAEHSWLTPDGVNACSRLGTPFFNNCGIDMEKDFLSAFYGNLEPRNWGKLDGKFIQFNQVEFCPQQNCTGIAMDDTAWVFVPRSCDLGQSCRLVVALHGCQSNQQTLGTGFMLKMGINEWADTNHMVVLYPQTINTPANLGGCWDWWGYTGSNYAIKSGPQMVTIMNEVHRLLGQGKLGKESKAHHPAPDDDASL